MTQKGFAALFVCVRIRLTNLQEKYKGCERMKSTMMKCCTGINLQKGLENSGHF